jgi:site-specific DNA-methyltransferase (adenine-specific)
VSEPTLYLNGRVAVHAGDCLSIMSSFAENSLDAAVCDPPYHLQSIVKRFAKTGRTDKTRTTSGPHQRTANGFMNKTWDGGDVAFQPGTWELVYDALKPGAFVIAFSSSRTYHHMAVAIEKAGFITHPLLGWVFGQGFPKAHRVDGEGWEGWRYGAQALKPALEPIYCGQKPFSEATGSANIARWGTGALNIDGCRVGLSDGDDARLGGNGVWTTTRELSGETVSLPRGTVGSSPLGRWPANLVHDGSAEVLAAFPETESGAWNGKRSAAKFDGIYHPLIGAQEAGHDGDSGSAARFFYSAKADSDDRLGSKHPTVKPVDLMQWLCRLVCPPGGTILDPFAGTGTTGAAAWREGFNAVLIEREAEYLADIARRMKLCLAGPDERARESIKARNAGKPDDHGPLFDPVMRAAE